MKTIETNGLKVKCDEAVAESIARRGCFQVTAVLLLIKELDVDGFVFAFLVGTGEISISTVLVALVGYDRPMEEAKELIKSLVWSRLESILAGGFMVELGVKGA